MDFNKFSTVINQAIDNKKSVNLTFKHGVSDKPLVIKFDPYIFGDDTMQYTFIWGYMPNDRIYYRAYFDRISDVSLTNEHFEIKNDALYLYAIEEEHWNRVKGLDGAGGKVYAEGLVERTS